MNTFAVYNLNFCDFPSEDRKMAVFYDCTKAIQYVEYMAMFGDRYGVFDKNGERQDQE